MIKSQNSAADSNVPRDDKKRQTFAKPAKMKERIAIKSYISFPQSRYLSDILDYRQWLS